MLPEDPSGRAEFLPSQTDIDLVTALRMGDTAALGVIYDRHAGLVYGIALKFLNNTQESEDLTHDIFLQLAKTAAYDPERSSLRTFLAVLTRSRALDQLRRRNTQDRAVRQRAFRKRLDVTANLPLEDLFQRELSQEMHTALTHLSEEQQAVLKLIYYEGLSQPNIAKRLGLPLTTVKARARRGLLKLRQIFKEGEGHQSL